MNSQLNITKPCSENWETMKIGLQSRFCDNCQKNVVDFTEMDKREILEYLLVNRTDNVCGRIHRSQIDFSNTDLLFTVQVLSKMSINSNIPFYLLTVGTLILASCTNETNDKQLSIPDQTTIIQIDSTNSDINVTIGEPKDTIKSDAQSKINIPLDLNDYILGGMSLYYDTLIENTEPYQIVEIMPEFKGGIESLMSFLSKNLIYPDWERENEIEGKILVSFIVDKNGKVKEPTIIKTLKGSKNFDKEVIRVINKMPNWIPGQKNGKKVDVQFNLPIDFKL